MYAISFHYDTGNIINTFILSGLGIN